MLRLSKNDKLSASRRSWRDLHEGRALYSSPQTKEAILRASEPRAACLQVPKRLRAESVTSCRDLKGMKRSHLEAWQPHAYPYRQVEGVGPWTGIHVVNPKRAPSETGFMILNGQPDWFTPKKVFVYADTSAERDEWVTALKKSLNVRSTAFTWSNFFFS